MHMLIVNNGSLSLPWNVGSVYIDASSLIPTHMRSHTAIESHACFHTSRLGSH